MESLEMTVSFWHGKRVFLTGHTGFKGGWLALWLEKLGAVVTGYALDPSTHPSLHALASGRSTSNSVIADIRDLPRMSFFIWRPNPLCGTPMRTRWKPIPPT